MISLLDEVEIEQPAFKTNFDYMDVRKIAARSHELAEETLDARTLTMRVPAQDNTAK